MLLGRSIVGVRAGDVIRVAATVMAREDIEDGGEIGVSRGNLGPVLLHAAAFDPPTFSRIALIDSLESYASLVHQEHYSAQWVHASVPGALAEYDLPDLAASLDPLPQLLPTTTDRGFPELLDYLRSGQLCHYIRIDM